MGTEPITFIPSEIWAVFIAFLGAVVLINQVWGIYTKWAEGRKAPDATQDARLTALEKRCDSMEKKLDNDNTRLNRNDESNRITQRALLALMAHALDGNSVEQLRRAKTDLQNYLIDKS